MVPQNVEPLDFALIWQQIACELSAPDSQQKLANPRYWAYLTALYRLALESQDIAPSYV